MNAAIAAEQLSARRSLIFVLGMGRSGTSALTRVVSLCGSALPLELLGSTEGNPLGHFEPRKALELNEAFLSSNSATWYDPTLRLQGEFQVAAAQRAAYIEQIEAFLHSLPACPQVVIKEPRITGLSDFWFEAADRAGFSIGIIIAVRHPEEVVASLAARDRTTRELASALWLKYNLLAERQSRRFPRVVVDYSNLLQNWRRETARIATALSIDPSARDDGAIEQFLQTKLHRQRHAGGISECFGSQLLSRTYSALSGAARDETLDTQSLDEIFETYRACERAFRVALDEFRARFAPAVTTRKPNITRLMYAVGGRDSELLKSSLRSHWYVERNPDVFAARLDPYEQWFVAGANEGRLPTDDPLSLLDGLMQERLGQPAAPAHALAAQAAPAQAVPARTAPRAVVSTAAPHAGAPVSEPLKVRVVCATREKREAFYERTALGRSLSLYRPVGVELRLFAQNTRGLSSVYNTAIEETGEEREILLFVHDDLHLCDYFWAERLREGLGTFDVIGLAGARSRVAGQPGWGMIDERLSGARPEEMSGIVGHGSGFPADSIDVFGPARQSVKLLDGLFIAVTSQTLREASLRFDERFDFHFYDLDFCRQAEQAGLTMGTWPIAVVHESKGGYASESWRRAYHDYLAKWKS